MNVPRALLTLAACWLLFSVWDAYRQPPPPPFALQHEARP